MRANSRAETGYPEINMAQIRVGGGVAGLIFAVGSVLVFAIGIPSLRVLLVTGAAAGVLISGVLHVAHKYWPPAAPPAIR